MNATNQKQYLNCSTEEDEIKTLILKAQSWRRENIDTYNLILEEAERRYAKAEPGSKLSIRDICYQVRFYYHKRINNNIQRALSYLINSENPKFIFRSRKENSYV